jgi:hypothetical protein
VIGFDCPAKSFSIWEKLVVPSWTRFQLGTIDRLGPFLWGTVGGTRARPCAHCQWKYSLISATLTQSISVLLMLCEQLVLRTRRTMCVAHFETSRSLWPSMIANYEMLDPAKSLTHEIASAITGEGPGENANSQGYRWRPHDTQVVFGGGRVPILGIPNHLDG